jgi:hypothetical protein
MKAKYSLLVRKLSLLGLSVCHILSKNLFLQALKVQQNENLLGSDLNFVVFHC